MPGTVPPGSSPGTLAPPGPSAHGPALPTAVLDPVPDASSSAGARIVSVLLVSRELLVRDGLGALVSAAPGLRVAGVTADVDEALDILAIGDIDVVVIPRALLSLGGAEQIRSFRSGAPTSALVLLVSRLASGRLVHAVSPDAPWLVSMRSPAHVFVEVIRAAGRRTPRTAAARDAAARWARHVEEVVDGGATTPDTVLTPRQVEVLQLVTAGRANKQVAMDLGISIKTVEKHRQLLMRRLHVHDMAGLLRYGIAARDHGGSMRSRP